MVTLSEKAMLTQPTTLQIVALRYEVSAAEWTIA